ncbi:MAG TPA: universal stress protein [Chitinophagaceae bacterium]|nr:universal stress protein [Chitinophagaceae bacterium]
MASNLYNVLVPIDFSQKDKWAIAKAVELSNALNCCIHLVHVVSTFAAPFMSSGTSSTSFSEGEYAGKRLKELKGKYQHHLCANGSIEISVLHGYPRAALKKYIEYFEIDMVIKGLSRFNLIHRVFSSVSISRLARKINVPVLAVNAGGLTRHFKKILLPVNKNIPLRSIRMTVILGRYFKSTIYVLSLRREDNNFSLLNATLEVIQSLTTIPVQSIILEGKNLAEATLDFSRKINADLIMISSGREFFLSGLWNAITKKLLSYKSKTPVITVDNNAS